MSNYLKTKSSAERIDILSANAQKKESFSYFKQYSEEELLEEKENYFNHMSRMDSAKANLERAKAEFKELTAVPAQIAKESYTIISNKGKQITEDVYLIPNHDAATIDYVNEDGETVFTRRMLAGERQLMLKVSSI